VETVVGDLTADPLLVVPVGQLLAVVAVAALAGLAACVVPARRGARIVPAAGLTSE
jgi:putative ABC transport system permease protein